MTHRAAPNGRRAELIAEHLAATDPAEAFTETTSRRRPGIASTVLSRSELIVQSDQWIGKHKQGRGQIFRRGTFALQHHRLFSSFVAYCAGSSPARVGRGAPTQSMARSRSLTGFSQ